MLTSRGYMLVRSPKHPLAQKRGWVLEHRMVWFDANGAIPRGYTIHHKNGDRLDNRLDNLECLSMSHHSKHHYDGKLQQFSASGRAKGTQTVREHGPWNKETAGIVALRCDACGKKFQRLARKHRQHRKDGSKHIYCSLRCNGQGQLRAARPEVPHE